jgi:hypothetical protein
MVVFLRTVGFALHAFSISSLEQRLLSPVEEGSHEDFAIRSTHIGIEDLRPQIAT